MVNLKTLNLSYNEILLLQKQIGGMKSLEVLYLQKNKLNDFQKNQVKKFLPQVKIYF